MRHFDLKNQRRGVNTLDKIAFHFFKKKKNVTPGKGSALEGKNLLSGKLILLFWSTTDKGSKTNLGSISYTQVYQLHWLALSDDQVCNLEILFRL